MSRAKFAAARELIEEKHYDAARSVLKTMKGDELAKTWLKKLPKRKRRLPLMVVILFLTFCVGIYAGSTTQSSRDIPIPTVAALAIATSTPLLTIGTSAPSATITQTHTPLPSATITMTPTENFALTDLWRSGEQTRAALGLMAQSTNIALTQLARPTAAPPTQQPLLFEGNTNQVLGSVTLPKGLYRARVTTAGFFIAQLQVTQGECGSGSFFSPLLFLT